MLHVQNLSLQLGGKQLFDKVGFSIESGEKVAIIGRNGAGKSSLLRVISGDMQPDFGSVDSGSSVVATLAQEVPEGGEGNLLDYVLAALDDELRWDRQHKAVPLLEGLQLDPDADMAHLSGGEWRRVLLARALIQEPDILLLDEPTNHLDMPSIQWLETFLKTARMTVLFITHDRALLQAVATAILTVDVHDVTVWRGTYRGYLSHQETVQAAREKANADFDKRLAQEEVWIRQGIQARRTRNEGRVRALKAMRREYAARKDNVGQVSLAQQELTHSGKLVFEVDRLNYRLADRVLIDDFSCLVAKGSKIGIVGPNGIGKSTLIRCLLAKLEPTSGSVKHGTKLEIAYFDQRRQTLNDNDTVLDAVAGGTDTITIGGVKKHIYSYLQDFLFTPDKAQARIGTLSGGERNRVLLAKHLAKPANLLVLDEPTNDLDIETLELLESYLSEYQGTVLLISHDRSFLDNVVTHSWVFRGNGVIEQHVGGFQESWLAPINESERPPVLAKKDMPAVSYEERKEYNRLPDRIANHEKKIEVLHESMADPSFYEQEPSKIQAVQEECERLEKACEALYERWAELEEKMS